MWREEAQGSALLGEKSGWKVEVTRAYKEDGRWKMEEERLLTRSTKAPTTDSFRRAKEKEDHHRRFLRTTITEWGLRHTARATSSDRYGQNDNFDGETTFM